MGPLDGFISKMGRPFSSKLRLNDEFKLEFDFGNDAKESDEPVDVSKLSVVGKCPKCGSNVYDSPKGYVCEKTLEKACDFRIGKTILQQPISAEEAAKILTEGKSSELQGFVSNRTKRNFSAYLVLGKDGTVGFEFAQQKSKTSRRKTTAKK
ncbi:MAG: topoisomerase C-terminal repeat-containing protein [Ligilactobacillus ruminis]